MSTSDTPPTFTNLGSMEPAPRKPLVSGEPELNGREVQGRYRYRLESRIARGGFGSVYIGTCLDSNTDDTDSPPRNVAIKIFHPPETGELMTGFRREMSALLALRNSRIIRIHDWGVDGKFAFIALKLYPSGTLREHLSLVGPMSEEAVARLLVDILTALVSAHRASILHLDIKPGNILLDGRGGYVLTDFGISQGSLVSRTIVSTGIGSLGYQAPEQRLGEHDRIDARTDLFGIGACAWSAATGILVDQRGDLVQQGDKVPFGLPPVRAYRPRFSKELEAQIQALVANDPTARPGGAAEALTRVKMYLGDPNVTPFSSPAGHAPTPEELQRLLENMVDPLWASIASRPAFQRTIVIFRRGEMMCREGEASHTTFVLLSGSILVRRGEQTVAREAREGTFLGEVATLTGEVRTATLVADSDVCVSVLNAAELERFVATNPPVAIRLLHSLADRLLYERTGRSPASEGRGSPVSG